MVKFANSLSLHADRNKYLNISFLQGCVCGSWWSQTKGLDISNSSLKVLIIWELKKLQEAVLRQSKLCTRPSASQSMQLLSLNLSICGTMDPTVCCRNPTGNGEWKNYIAFLKEHSGRDGRDLSSETQTNTPFRGSKIPTDKPPDMAVNKL